MTSPSLIIITLLLISKSAIVASVGGIAEMKALTGDAPYLGTGNQEQAPEYFGQAAYRQYYNNPAYGGQSRYWNNYYNGGYNNPYYRTPYRAYGDPCCNGGQLAYGGGTVYTSKTTITSPTGGGFYAGQGNDWVKN